MQSIVLGGGCFWCIEAVMQRVRGVSNVLSGYAGGSQDTANYAEVCSGATDHIEVVKVEFDEDLVSLQQILSVFFAAHDPTSVDQQGADKGSQYRSVVFCASKEQLDIVEAWIEEQRPEYSSDVVTKVTIYTQFYLAEKYHQNFYNSQPEYGYCKAVIDPKLKKLFGT